MPNCPYGWCTHKAVTLSMLSDHLYDEHPDYADEGIF